MAGTILVIGEALIDEVHRGEDVARHPGGSPANVALGLARLDNEVTLLSQWGSDADGELLSDHLTDSGVEIFPGTRTAADTSRAIATLDEAGAATYDFQLSWDPQPDGDFSEVFHVHTGSIATVIQPGAATVERLVAALRSQATISLDPNARPTLMGEPHEAFAQISQLLVNADIVKASDEDVDWFTGGSPVTAVAQEWLDRGAGLVVITKGADGVSVYSASGEASQPAFSTTVADTVGAGDSLMGGLIDALGRLDLLGAHRRQELKAISRDDLSKVVTWASAISAITVSRDGANPPTTAEVRDFLSERDIASPF